MTHSTSRLSLASVSLWLLCTTCAGALACADDPSGVSGSGDDEADAGSGEEAEDSGEEGSSATFEEEREITLRITDTPPPDLTLQMGRDEVTELFGPVAQDIDLLELDSTPLLENTLEAIKFACGSDWQDNDSDPNHDCSQTTLGQSFGDGDWENSPEFGMVRILTMTPANSVVDGTSLDSVEGLANFILGLAGGFPGLLAESLDISETTEFLDTPAVVASLKRNLIGTHPETSAEGTITVTLEDALTDMATLGERLGPVGEHPGIIVPGTPTEGAVFGPDFEMKVIAESNLKVLDGVDLGDGKAFISVIADLVGPSFDDEAEFDFNDPAKFSMTGLVDDPVLDLRFGIRENDAFIDSCTSLVSESCVDNAPDNPVGDGLVWTLDPWELEYLVADAGRVRYSSLQAVVNYLLLGDVVEVGQNGTPGGWGVFNVPLGFLFGEPPDQYMWELINEIAQYDLHHLDNITFPEGEADVEFTLEDIPVGITGEEAAAAVRPFLQAQSSDIAGYLLGNYKENSGPVDFYYRRASDGAAYLFFVTPDDLLDGLPYGWDKPGFYADADLETKASSTALDGIGDTSHEKLLVPPGETTVYVEDDEGDTYRVRLFAPEGDDTEIFANVAKRTN